MKDLPELLVLLNLANESSDRISPPFSSTACFAETQASGVCRSTSKTCGKAVTKLMDLRTISLDSIIV